MNDIHPRDSLPVKKAFLQRAFYPIGDMVCDAVGIVPTSADVSQVEAEQALIEVRSAADVWGDLTFSRVQWYLQGYEAMRADNPDVPERDLTEHLASFGLSLIVEERSMVSIDDEDEYE